MAIQPIEKRIQLLAEWQEQRLLLPTPPTWEPLLHQVRAAGLPIQQVFVVRAPLTTGVRGSYHRDSQEVWCFLDQQDPQGERLALMCLFVLFAHATLQQPTAQTIQQDFEQERAAWKHAPLLAQRWGWPELFQEQDLQERLSEIDLLCSLHQAAAALVGTSNPSVARAAYRTLIRLQEQMKWDEAHFHAALEGRSTDEATNAALMDFDRTPLRSLWRMTSGQRQDSPFGALTLPQTAQAASLLQESLEAASHLQRTPIHATALPWSTEASLLSFSCVSIQTEQDLAHLIEIITIWLLEEAPDLALDGRWEVFGKEETSHLYRLTVRYVPTIFTPERQETERAEVREMWVRFEQTGLLLETAWQRYILGWRQAMAIQYAGPLQEAISQLWSLF